MSDADLIDEIERQRRLNRYAWAEMALLAGMPFGPIIDDRTVNILRAAIKASPEQAKTLIGRISWRDHKIANLGDQLSRMP